MRARVLGAGGRWVEGAGAAAALTALLGAGAAAGQPAGAPAGGGATAPAAPATAPAGIARPAAVAPPAPIDLELGGVLGMGLRADDGPHFEMVERAGLAYGVSAFVTVEPEFSLGLALEHTDLGRERSAVGEAGAVEVVRDLNAAWAAVRLNLVRGAAGELGVLFGPGLAWQSADAAGVAAPTRGAVTFTCAASGAAGLALRAGLGGSLALGGGLFLNAGATLDNIQLSSDLLDGCVFGAGSATIFGLRGGFTYRFDLGRYVR